MSSDDTADAAIEFRRVQFVIGGRELIPDLSLAVRRGETMVLLGRSGSGKTTLLKLINRLLAPTRGEVAVEGRATTAWGPIQLRRHTGYAIQEGGLFPHFTVERNVGLVPRLEGWPESRVQARVEETLALAGLEPGEFRHRYPYQLSGGQRQRVGVARALAADPPILLMDEPFGSLDPITRAGIRREFQQLARRVGKTIVFVTHDLDEALFLADRIALLDAGRLTGVYAPAEFCRSAEPTARKYMEAFRAGDRADLLS